MTPLIICRIAGCFFIPRAAQETLPRDFAGTTCCFKWSIDRVTLMWKTLNQLSKVSAGFNLHVMSWRREPKNEAAISNRVRWQYKSLVGPEKYYSVHLWPPDRQKRMRLQSIASLLVLRNKKVRRLSLIRCLLSKLFNAKGKAFKGIFPRNWRIISNCLDGKMSFRLLEKLHFAMHKIK